MPLPDGLLDRFVRRDPDGQPHGGQVFVETGTHRGDGVQAAVDAGFEAVYSCDVSPFAFGWSSCRFRDRRTQVHLFLQDSQRFLLDRMRHLIAPAVFWLDAHWCGGDGEMDGRDAHLEGDAPLVGELQVIGNNGKPGLDHVILVDDLRMMGRTRHFPTREALDAALLAVNPRYRLVELDGRDHPGDILAAYVPPEPAE